MSEHVIERVAKALYPQDEKLPHADNVKFYLGNQRLVTAEALADQLARADAQVRTGAAKQSKALDAGMDRKSY